MEISNEIEISKKVLEVPTSKAVQCYVCVLKSRRRKLVCQQGIESTMHTDPKFKGDDHDLFSRTSNCWDSSILRLGTLFLRCDPHILWESMQGSQSGPIFIRKFCPRQPVTFWKFLFQASQGKIFLSIWTQFGTICEPYLVSYGKCGSKPKNGVPSLKIDESQQFDVREKRC